MNSSQRRNYYRAIARQWPAGTEVQFFIGGYLQSAVVERASKVGRSVFVLAGGISCTKSIASLRKVRTTTPTKD